MPDLVVRGLLETRQEKVLWLFPVTRHRHTPEGERAKRALEAQLEEARTLPDLLSRSPAVAVAATLGGTLLLVDELGPFHVDLARARRQQQPGSDNGSNGSNGSGDVSADGGNNNWEEDADAGAGDFDFDASALDASAFDAFDASFDTSSSGDSGGDGGGGGGD